MTFFFYSLEQTRSLKSNESSAPSYQNEYSTTRTYGTLELRTKNKQNQYRTGNKRKKEHKKARKKTDHFPSIYRAASGESFARDSPPSSSLHLFTFLGAVIVKTPSEDRLEVMLITSWDGGKTYLRMNCRLTNPCSSCLSSCFASTITLLPTVFTVISSGENCWTSSITCGDQSRAIETGPKFKSRAKGYIFYWSTMLRVMNMIFQRGNKRDLNDRWENTSIPHPVLASRILYIIDSIKSSFIAKISNIKLFHTDSGKG